MVRKVILSAVAASILAASLTLTVAASAQPSSASTPVGLQVETQYYTLPNGLKVVLAREPSIPTVTVGVYYGIGWLPLDKMTVVVVGDLATVEQQVRALPELQGMPIERVDPFPAG